MASRGVESDTSWVVPSSGVGPILLDKTTDMSNRMDAADTTKKKPICVTYLSVNLSPEVGRDDSIMAIRVVPDGRSGNVVYGRSLLPGEADDGRGVVFQPHEGERLEFRPNTLRFTIWDADRNTPTEPDGYRPLAPAIWTWIGLDGGPSDKRAFNYLLATARRLDGTHVLLGHFWKLLGTEPGNFATARKRMFEALSIAEILLVSLGRVVDLVDGLTKHLLVPLPLPTAIEDRKLAVRELRNACEHIEDRALGQVRGRPHPEAQSVFSQDALLKKAVFAYGQHALSLRSDVPAIVDAARSYVWQVAVHFSGEAKLLSQPVSCFSSRLPA